MKSKFINDDCMNYLPLYQDNYFDLAIVDPPYGIGLGHIANGGGAYHRHRWRRSPVRGTKSS